MKVALVCQKYSLDVGGLERDTVFLSRALIRSGHEVHVFANKWQPEPGIIFHRVPMVRFSSPGKNLSFAYFSGRALSKEKFDVIQSMERIFYQDIFRASDGINPVQVFHRYARPVVRRFKAIAPRRLALSYLERRIFLGGGAKIIMTNSNLVKRQIVEHYGVKPERIIVIYNGVNTTKFHPGLKAKYRDSVREECGLGKDALVLLFISNDFKLKGLQLVLQAMALLQRKDLRLMVIGNDDKNPYLKWAARYGLDRQVVFLGPQRGIEKYYGASDIFVLPTLYDAFANVCLEAMASGLPVITTKTTGASELMRDGEEGYVLQTREARELAAKIEVLGSAKERLRMGKKAANVAKGYTVERHVQEVLALYDQVRT